MFKSFALSRPTRECRWNRNLIGPDSQTGRVIDSAEVTPAPFALEVRDLQQSYPTPTGRLEVLRGLSFSLQPGLVLAMVGPSGSGKSTLLHLIGGLETPSSGEVI